jgi:flagellin-like protein
MPKRRKRMLLKKPKDKKSLLKDDNAVSPMIATIMLIAIAVVLGAVIAASSMKSAGNIDTQGVTATLTATQQAPGTYNIILAHAGGDRLTGGQLGFSLTSGENSPVNLVNFTTGYNSGVNNSIASPTSLTTFTAGNNIQFIATTDSTPVALASGNIYHMVVRYLNTKVLLDTNVRLS